MLEEIKTWKLNIIYDPGLDLESEKSNCYKYHYWDNGEIWIIINI